MATRENTSIDTIKRFIQSLKKDGLDVSDVYLFGSMLDGTADADSDIDLAVVSEDFQGIPYYDIKKVSKHRRKIDLRLEIHPFSKQEVEQDPPAFFVQIRQKGLRIEV